MDTDPKAPREELASAEIDGPGNIEARVRKVFETRDPRVAPKPPGVTVMLYSERSYHYWGATLAGTPANEFRAISHSTNHGLEESPVLGSYEEAKAHFLLRASEFVSRVTGRPCDPDDLQNIKFVEA